VSLLILEYVKSVLAYTLVVAVTVPVAILIVMCPSYLPEQYLNTT